MKIIILFPTSDYYIGNSFLLLHIIEKILHSFTNVERLV